MRFHLNFNSVTATGISSVFFQYAFSAMMALIGTLAITGCGGSGMMDGPNISRSLTSSNGTAGSNSYTYKTTTQTVTATVGTPITLTWDLNTQLLTSLNPLNGSPDAQFSIQVQAITLADGSLQYEFSNPTTTTGTQGFETRSLGIQINGVSTSTPLYSSLDVVTPAHTTSQSLSTNTQLVNMSPNSGDTITITFGALVPVM